MRTYRSDPVSPRGTVIGLTKREYFTAMAMQGLLSGADYNPALMDLTKQSVEIADALIDELNKQEDENNKTKL